jgi:hypothetical protein
MINEKSKKIESLPDLRYTDIYRLGQAEEEEIL